MGSDEGQNDSLINGAPVTVPRPRLFLTALLALALTPALSQAQYNTRDRDRERERERQREQERQREHERDARSVRTVRISMERRSPAPDREITMSVGALRSDDDSGNLPMAAIRTDWRLRRWLRSEVGVSYAIGNTERLESGVIPADERTLQLGTATVGLRAELPGQYLRPYVGVAAGLAMRAEEDGARYVRTTMAFPAGLRVLLSDRVSVRAEARFRFDQRRGGGEAYRVEQTGGLSVAF